MAWPACCARSSSPARRPSTFRCSAAGSTPSAQIQYAPAQWDELPFAITEGELVQYATDRAMRRIGTIESARGADVTAIDVDAAPEQLEEQFGEEDTRALAAACAA